jgi:hypothetical protein
LAAVLRLPPPTVAALRAISLDDVATLSRMIDNARVQHRAEMERAVAEIAPALPLGKVYRRATKGRRS